MKYIYIFVFLIVIIIHANSQSIWEFKSDFSGTVDLIGDAIEYKQGCIISVTRTFPFLFFTDDFYKYQTLSTIRIHDLLSGSILNEVTYGIDSLAVNLMNIFYSKEKSRFVIVGEAHVNTIDEIRGYFLVSIWDEKLNLVEDTVVRLEPYNENNVIRGMKRSFRFEEDFLINANYSDNIYYPSLNNKVLFVKLTKEGKIAKLKWYKSANVGENIYRGSHQNIIKDKKNSRYLIIGGNRIYLDYNFNITHVFSSNSPGISVDKFGCSAFFSENNYLVSVLYRESKTGQDLGLAIFNDNLELKKKGTYIEFQNDTGFPDYVNYNFSNQNFDFIDTTEIFFANYSNRYNFLSVVKLNSNLNPFWLKYYSLDDENRYHGCTIAATSDGGFILSGGKGKAPDIPGIYPSDISGWLQKFDADGNTVSTKDHSPTRWEITVYPNPSSGNFRIEIAGEVHSAVLMLFDMQGRQVRHYDQLSEGSHTFDFSGLPIGAYVWKLLHNGEALGDGKWIKGR